jgi:hypothetical protein
LKTKSIYHCVVGCIIDFIVVDNWIWFEITRISLLLSFYTGHFPLGGALRHWTWLTTRIVQYLVPILEWLKFRNPSYKKTAPTNRVRGSTFGFDINKHTEWSLPTRPMGKG